jgi:hypothetical protein
MVPCVCCCVPLCAAVCCYVLLCAAILTLPTSPPLAPSPPPYTAFGMEHINHLYKWNRAKNPQLRFFYNDSPSPFTGPKNDMVKVSTLIG